MSWFYGAVGAWALYRISQPGASTQVGSVPVDPEDLVFEQLRALSVRSKQAIDAAGSELYGRATDTVPELRDPLNQIVKQSPSAAGDGLGMLIDKARDLSGDSDGPEWAEALAAVDQVWARDPETGEFGHLDTGGLDLIKKALLKTPEVRDSIRSASSYLLPTKIYADLTESVKVLTWIAGLGGYVFAQAALSWDGKKNKFTLSAPNGSSVTVSKGKIVAARTTLSTTLPIQGLRSKKNIRTSIDIKYKKGEFKGKGSVAIPLADHSSLRAGVQIKPGLPAQPTIGYQRNVRGGLQASVSATPGVAPGSDRSVTAELSGPLTSRRLRRR